MYHKILQRLIATTSLIAVAACASQQTLPAAPMIPGSRVTRAQIEASLAPIPSSPQDRPGVGIGTNPVSATVNAQRQGTVVPNPKDFIGATYKVPYYEDFQYSVYVAAGNPEKKQPPNITTIIMNGDSIIDAVTADNVYWDIKKVNYGSGKGSAAAIIVKARVPGKTTQLIVFGRRGRYMFNLKSFENTHHVALEFTYPQEERAQEVRSMVRASGADMPQCSSAGYSIKGKAPWSPTSVCNDGTRTLMYFPQNIGAVGAPALFETDAKGNEARVANYTLKDSPSGPVYVIDGVSDGYLLKVGKTAVGIKKG